jgi:CheY-like chemotaxis protein/anti-sigma regulatory factor (Ser/Thr protein kinase)
MTLPLAPIHLHADFTRLSQVFANLLNNACKYTEPGGRIGVTARQQNGQVEVRVRDTGIGIPPESLPHIFDMFTQVDASLERAQGGLGIGLTLVRRLVEMHGGTVVAESAGKGKGSEFIVRLPASSALVPTSKPSSPAGGKCPALPKRKILVVDDNKDAADTMGMILKMLGNEVRTVYDGRAALEAVETFGPSLLLLDIGLPVMNGYEVARNIRAKHGQEIVIAALTGWGQDEDRRRSKEAGFDHHLVKPASANMLRNLLGSLPPV